VGLSSVRGEVVRLLKDYRGVLDAFSDHRGPLLALSRRGLAPRTHAAGGAWPEFLHDRIPASALALTKIIRQQIALAASQGVAWQRVFDAARSAVPSVWNEWS